MTQPFQKLPLTRAMGLNLDIDGWLRRIGLAQYAEMFRANDIDGELLRRLTNDDLKDVGVVSFGHRKQLLEAIAELASAPAAPAMPTLIPAAVAPPPISASVDAVGSVRRLMRPRTTLPIDRPEIIARPDRETLDPDDWSEALAISRGIPDDAVAYLRDVRDRPVWKEIPREVRASFDAPLPRKPESLAEVYREVAETVMAYPMGNVHPRFWTGHSDRRRWTCPTPRQPLRLPGRKPRACGPGLFLFRVQEACKNTHNQLPLRQAIPDPSMTSAMDLRLKTAAASPRKDGPCSVSADRDTDRLPRD